MNILIVGGRGQLGSELVKSGRGRGYRVTTLDLPGFDISDQAAVNSGVQGHDLVINAAAYTAVDRAESDRDRAFAANSKGPLNLACACRDAKIPLIHVSTDYVFDGSKEEPYLPSDPVSPRSVYGKSKAQGDEGVRSSLDEHIIIRTSWVFGPNGNNFVKTMLSLASKMEAIRVVNDQYGCPTYAPDLAEAVLAVADKIGSGAGVNWGTYHFCNSGVTTWHGFATGIIKGAEPFMNVKTKRIDPVPTSEYPTPAQRPMHSVLDCRSFTENFDIMPRPWQESLSEMLRLFLKPSG